MVTAYQNQTDRRNVQHSTVAVPQQNKIKTSSSSLKSEIKLLASRPDWSFLLTSLYFQFSLIQAGRVGWCVCSRMSDQWRVPGRARPGHVTSLPSHPPGPPWPNQAADNFPFPGLFPSLSPSHCAQDSVSPMMIFPCISPSSPHPSLLSFKFELVETELKSPAPSFLSLNFSARSGVRNGDFSKAAPGAGKGNWKLL